MAWRQPATGWSQLVHLRAVRVGQGVGQGAMHAWCMADWLGAGVQVGLKEMKQVLWHACMHACCLWHLPGMPWPQQFLIDELSSSGSLARVCRKQTFCPNASTQLVTRDHGYKVKCLQHGQVRQW